MVGYWIYILRTECILSYQMPPERIPRKGWNDPSGNFVPQTSVTFLLLIPGLLGVMIRGVHHPLCMGVSECGKTPESCYTRNVFIFSHSSRNMDDYDSRGRPRSLFLVREEFRKDVEK
jgi:hypothetical protein